MTCKFTITCVCHSKGANEKDTQGYSNKARQANQY